MDDTLAKQLAPAPITQSISRAGQMLPDHDLSAEDHARISREAFAMHMAGTNDIGLHELAPDHQLKAGLHIEKMNQAPAEMGGRPIPDEFLTTGPKGSIAQGLAIIEEQKKQEERLQFKMNLGYVRGRDYGRECIRPDAKRLEEIKQEIYAEARRNGVELDPTKQNL